MTTNPPRDRAVRQAVADTLRNLVDTPDDLPVTLWSDDLGDLGAATTTAVLQALQPYPTPPCDGGCHHDDAPVEDCSLHGRSPAYLWSRVHSLERDRAQILAVHDCPPGALIGECLHCDSQDEQQARRIRAVPGQETAP